MPETSPPFADLLAMGALVHRDPPVVLNKDGSLMTTLAFTPLDLSYREPSFLDAYFSRLDHALRLVSEPHDLLFDAWTLPTLSYPEPEHPWTNPTAAFVDASRRLGFATVPAHATTRFLTLTWRPPTEKAALALDRALGVDLDSAQTWDADTAAARFLTTAQSLRSHLEPLFPEVRQLTSDELSAYLHLTVSLDFFPTRTPDIPYDLSSQLTDKGFTHAYTPILGPYVLQPFTVKSWPEGDQAALGAFIPTALQALAFPFRSTLAYSPLDPEHARALIDTEERKWKNIPARLSDLWKRARTRRPDELAEPEQDNLSLTYARSLKEARRALDAGDAGFGHITPQLLLWHTDPRTLQDQATAVQALLHTYGLTLAQEDVGATEAFLAQVPGNDNHTPRTVPVPSPALALLCPHTEPYAGPTRDTHFKAEPLFIARAWRRPGVVRVALHPPGSEVGSGAIVGPTRSGKSALLGFILSQVHRYPGMQLFVFDKDEALMAATLLHGGTHYDMASRTRSTGTDNRGLFTPLEHCSDLSEQTWALDWLVSLATSQGLPPTAEEKARCFEALVLLGDLTPGLRTLTTWTHLLQAPRLQPAFAPFLRGGAYPIFDATEDTLKLADFMTFEMRPLLESPQVLPPALRYIFHRLQSRFTGRRTLVVLDESRKLLIDPTFAPEILDMLKERQKVNVSTLLASQEGFDLEHTDCWQAIKGSVQSWYFLPNHNATTTTTKPFYLDCGLSEELIAVLPQLTTNQDYLYVTPHGAAPFTLRLSPLERLLTAASSPEERTQLKEMAQTTPYPALVPAWLRLHGFKEQARVYETFYMKGPDRETALLDALRRGARSLLVPRAVHTNGTHPLTHVGDAESFTTRA